jgi:hypothetical protein
MNKTVAYSTASLVVGVVIGVAVSSVSGVDLLSTRQNLDLVLISPLTVRNGSGHELVLPEHSTVTVRSTYQDEATAVIEFVADTAIMKQVAAPAESDPTYFHDESGK